MSRLPSNKDWESIAAIVSDKLSQALTFSDITSVSGGDIHQSFRVVDKATQQAFFIKLNNLKRQSLLQAEAQSLEAISAVKSIKTPQILLCDTSAHYAFLIMEYLPLALKPLADEEYLLGQQLAHLHKKSEKVALERQYGFDHDNFIGLSPQKNQWHSKWSEFWINERLQPQLELAYQNGFASDLRLLETNLLAATNKLLKPHQPESVLLHGDLWAGNKAFLQDGQPVIFDPASYYGDRETDIAMTELFGGFSASFYEGYRSVWSLSEAYGQRKKLYNLYHMINHLNLFGSGYLPQVKTTIHSLISYCL